MNPNDPKQQSQQRPMTAGVQAFADRRIVAVFTANPVRYIGKTRERFYLDGTDEATTAKRTVAEREQVVKSFAWFVPGQSVVIVAQVEKQETTEILVLGPGDRVRYADDAPAKA